MPFLRSSVFLMPMLLLLSGCQTLKDSILQLGDLHLLGVTPAPGYSDPDSVDAGLIYLSIGAEDSMQRPIAPLLELVVIRDKDNQKIPIEDGTSKSGHEQGSLLVLADSSGSLINTDPDEYRISAIQKLATELHACAPDWRLSLWRFDNYPSEIVPWTTNTEDIVSGANQLQAEGGTALFDSVIESLESISQDQETSFQGGGAGVGAAMVVLSDGQDTASWDYDASSMNRMAESSGVRVHSLGLGPASDHAVPTSDDLVETLRSLSYATGGAYGAVSEAADLSMVTEAISKASCGGYTLVTARMPEPGIPGSIEEGSIGIVNSDVVLPFQFRAP